ncbi:MULTISPECIES: hypothetical protein [Streptomyces]|uniref:Uncharacterized protein n=1 Tax=Streptomyces venezuelae (strain ATCC 10712 / CBS 650.69 / DSM 40230 / JCM 4526 / NBRC 13096 / PD 04745) TaxID=953739 RepID=F2R4K6_STRVP|nr:hypothetical protein [Streptomyces venezuelae]APE19697.1 hypothetical protein vnz_00920 [Streptomyces venezuelae]CCA53483.1 hypothetical protein SVEN_0195 [Streptomyces venezuelae ATCC 10712]
MNQRHLLPPGGGPAARSGHRPAAGFAARTVGGLTGRAITVAAGRAAEPGGLRFTERQLYYETCRVLSPGSAFLRGRIAGTPAPVLRLPAFTRALDELGRESVPGLLPPPVAPPARPSRPEGAERSERPEPDLYDYGLPRLLLCQSRSIAGMLLANHIHLEAACPVLAADDALPLDPRMIAALERAGGATVHVLHDASPAGVALPARVRATLGPLSGVRVVSLGLVPRHVASLRLPTGRGPRPGPAGLGALPAALRPGEADWLAGGRFAEVAAVPPARLLRTVLRLTKGPRPPRDSLWSGLRGLRGTGFMTWPAA